MPLNRPALSLGPGPRGVQDARRWVVDVCRTSAAPSSPSAPSWASPSWSPTPSCTPGPPITVRVRGTREHPRVEVRDASPEPPLLPAMNPDERRRRPAASPSGAGSSIVARCSTAWGADVEERRQGRLVRPRRRARRRPRRGRPHRRRRPRRAAALRRGRSSRSSCTAYRCATSSASRRHYRELRREVRLLAWRTRTTTRSPRPSPTSSGPCDRQLARASAPTRSTRPCAAAATHRPAGGDRRRTARRPSAGSWSCSTSPTRSAATSGCSRWPARAEQVEFQRWFFGEFVRQAAGEPSRGRGTTHAGSRSTADRLARTLSRSRGRGAGRRRSRSGGRSRAPR